MKNLERKGETLKITPLLRMYAIPAVHVCDLLVCVVERERYDYKKQTMRLELGKLKQVDCAVYATIRFKR